MVDVAIQEKKDCTGCFACVNICQVNCISMESDSEGFLYPKVDYDICINCHRCINACPTINLKQRKVLNSPLAYACINRNNSVRMQSSSGGVFTLLAEQVLAEGGVVFGVRFDDQFGVEHSYTESRENIYRFQGSKYVQSLVGLSYVKIRNFLESGRKVLFTGTPCQIAGLISFLGKVYSNLYCVDIICHGVPSPYVWKKYLEYRKEKARSLIKRITFRRKDEGWKRFSVSFLFENGTEYRQIFDKDLYLRAFLKNVCLRPSCYACAFKTIHRESDITLADFWGIQNVVPEMDDDKGTSLIFVNTLAGQILFSKIKENLLWETVDINIAVQYNSSATKSVEKSVYRDKFFEEIDTMSFEELVKKYCKDNYYVIFKRKAKSLLCLALRRYSTFLHSERYGMTRKGKITK